MSSATPPQVAWPASQMRSNFIHLYADIFWFGIQSGSVLAFLAVYAARLGASEFEVSLLTAGPAIVNLLFSLPAARLLKNHSLLQLTYRYGVVHRAGYLLFMVLPWFMPLASQPQAIIWIILLISIPGTLLAIGFNALFAEVIPADYRAEVVGKRNALVAISITVSTLVCGLLLDHIVFPLNYQVVFGLGAIGALMSIFHVGRVRPLATPASERAESSGTSSLSTPPRQHLLRWDLLRSSFGLFLVAYLFFYVCQYTGIPLFPVYSVRVLKLTDGAISLGNALFYAAMLLASLWIRRLVARWGHRLALVIGATSFCVYPFILSQAHDALLYWVASVIGGAVWALVNAELVNRLMEKTPENDRPDGMALHNLALNFGILAGSLLGPVLSSTLGVTQALWVTGLLRLAAGLVLALWG